MKLSDGALIVMSKKRLGRGLDALLPERSISAEVTPDEVESKTLNAFSEIEIASIQPSSYQPRRHFSQDALQDLANSIREQGLMQPIVVRQRPQGGYELIAGERRWRASQLAGMTAIPAMIKTVTDQEASALALIENMQREDLNAMEEAMGLARLRDEFALTQQQIADAVGKSRAAIANLLRLMNLGAFTRRLLEHGELEMGHARALLALDGLAQDQMAQRVTDQGLSVRQTENLIRQLGQPAKANHTTTAEVADPDVRRLEQQITEKIGAVAKIKYSVQGQGSLTLTYANLEELDGILKHLGVTQD